MQTRRVIATVVALSAASAPIARAQQCPVYYLQSNPRGYAVMADTIDAGRTEAFRQGGEDGVVSVILPFSPGQSGDVVQAARPRMISLRCTDGELRAAVHEEDGSQRSLPAIPADAFARYRVRVNVTDADGPQIAFVLAPGLPPVQDTTGAVIDMFGGKVPLQPGDVSITTEVAVADSPPEASGRAELTLGGDYLFARGRVEGGPRVAFLVDAGASRTVLARPYLPEGAIVRELVGVAYGPDGPQVAGGGMGGLGGTVPTGQGLASLDALTLDDMTFRSPIVHVVDSLPDIGGRKLAGIVGNDLLRRAAAAVVRYPTPERPGWLQLGDHVDPDGAPALEAPFSIVGGLVMLEGTVGTRPLHLIFDTGARESLLSTSAAGDLGLNRGEGASDTFRGLDGAPVEAWPATLPLLEIGTGGLRDFRVFVADLPILDRLGLTGNGGLLGQNLRHHFSTIVLDWVSSTLRFYRDG
jgi:hypothetical protein